MTTDPTPQGSDDFSSLADTSQGLSHLGYSTEAVALFGIAKLSGIGFQTLCRLGGRDGIRRLLETKDVGAFDRLIAEAGGRFSATADLGDWAALRRCIWSQGAKIAMALADAGAGFCFDGDPAFPKQFGVIAPQSRPQWIFYQGDLSLLDRACVTVVGTRDPTQPGEFLARYAVSCAHEHGTPVISGLARGIDRIVHEWCLHLDLPTISVMGTGILTMYPARHAGLGAEIVRAGGLLLSEYMPDQGPTGEHFVWRNRLQAALGRLVIPAEWARKSGTAHTVRFAREFGRPVLCLSLTGASLSPDAGIGDRTFDLPHDHTAFLEAIGEGLASRSTTHSEPDFLQYNLFGTPD